MCDTLTGSLVAELPPAEIGNPLFDQLAALLGDPLTDGVWIMPEEVEQP